MHLRPCAVLEGFLVCRLDINFVFCQVDCSEEAELCQSFGVSCFSLYSWKLNVSSVEKPTSIPKLHLIFGRRSYG